MARKKTIHETQTNVVHKEKRNVSQYRDDAGLWWNKDNSRSVEDTTITNNISRTIDDNTPGRFRRVGSRLGGSFALAGGVLGGSLSFFFGIYIFVLLSRKFLGMPFYGFYDFVNGFTTNVAADNGFNNFFGTLTSWMGLATSTLSLSNAVGVSNVWTTLFDMFINLPYQLNMIITSALFVVNVVVNILMTAVSFGQGVFNMIGNTGNFISPVQIARENLQNMWFGW